MATSIYGNLYKLQCQQVKGGLRSGMEPRPYGIRDFVAAGSIPHRLTC